MTDGSPSADEVTRVRDTLTGRASTMDPYDALRAAGHLGLIELRPLVESFLDDASDPMLARAALQVLTRDWNMRAQYEVELEQFAKGVAWDAEHDVRVLALGEVGELLRSVERPHLFALLLKIFQSPDEPTNIRTDAYFALARALGRAWSELPSATQNLGDFDVDPAVLEAAVARARRTGPEA